MAQHKASILHASTCKVIFFKDTSRALANARTQRVQSPRAVPLNMSYYCRELACAKCRLWRIMPVIYFLALLVLLLILCHYAHCKMDYYSFDAFVAEVSHSEMALIFDEVMQNRGLMIDVFGY